MVEPKIGLEVHVQLNTSTKLFCPCPLAGLAAAEPNSLTCPTCLGHPGSKPVLNRMAVEKGIRIALALGCALQESMYFSRKTYFYPDMSKNFQITQYEIPLGKDGGLEITDAQGRKKTIRITRIHIEEDPAKLVHAGGHLESATHVLADYNRSGVPLCEIVTAPDFQTPKETRVFLQKLRSILDYIGVFDVGAAIKADANVSIDGGSRVEIKNVTGFVEVEKALADEIMRQKWLADDGKPVERETRAWVAEKRTTLPLRKKESEEDYGYIFEPDLTRINLAVALVNKAAKGMPELPHQKFERYRREYGINSELAASIVTDLDVALLFEQLVRSQPKLAASWINILKKTLYFNGLELRQTKLSVDTFSKLLELVGKGRVTSRGGELMLRELVLDASRFDELAAKYSKSEIDIGKLAEEVLKDNKKAVADYKTGSRKALQFLVGELVKKSGGRVDARSASKELEKELG